MNSMDYLCYELCIIAHMGMIFMLFIKNVSIKIILLYLYAIYAE